MRAILKTLMAAAAIAVLPVAAQAAQLTANYNSGQSQLDTAQISFNSGSSYSQVGAGMLAFDISASDISGLAGNLVYTWCLEPSEYIVSPATYTVGNVKDANTNVGGMGAAKAKLINELFARNWTNLQSGITAANTKQKAVALQFAIWEILTETSGTYNLSNGTARFQDSSDPSVITLSQSYLSALTGTYPLLSNLFSFYRVGGQDQLFQMAGKTSSEWVPEPGAIGLLGAGILGMGLLRRRKRA